MNTTWNILNGAVVGVALCAACCSAADDWGTDLAQGLDEAAKGDRPVLVEFTGSDWCSACKIMEANVLPNKDFKAFVAKNRMVTVQLDYPNGADKVTPEQRRVRQEIADRYGIRAYPTLLVLDSKGQPYGRIEGVIGSPEQHIQRLQSILDTRKTIKRELNAARKIEEGPARAKALQAVLERVPEELRSQFRPLVDEIMQNDTDDVFGYRKALSDKAAQDKQLEEVKAALLKVVGGRPFMSVVDEARATVHTFLDREDLLPFVRLSLYAYLSQSYVLQGNLTEALKNMDAAIAAAPDTSEAKEMQSKSRPMLLDMMRAQEEKAAK